MTKPTYSRLHEYYKERDFRPTFACFKTDEQIHRYERARLKIYRDLLHLPPRAFEGASVCEIGPDTGENALVFARWGANLTLVEPNRAAWPHIREYFERYGLSPHLADIVEADIEGFEPATRFDYINAEGFVYTVQPTTLWLDKFARLLRPGGLAVANYLDQTGCLFELLWSLCHARYQQQSCERGIESAWSIFEAKWNSIVHTRTFEAWVKDVLENPFVRLRYLIDPTKLSELAFAKGLVMHTSWPRYENPFQPYWHKTIPVESALEARRREFIDRSKLSFAFARPLFLVGTADRTHAINQALSTLVCIIDQLIDGWADEASKRAMLAIGILDQALMGADVMADSVDRAAARAALNSLMRLLGVLGKSNGAAVREFLLGDDALINVWGATTHYAVFRHTEDER